MHIAMHYIYFEILRDKLMVNYDVPLYTALLKKQSKCLITDYYTNTSI